MFAAAKGLYNEECILHIDDCAQGSHSEQGAYVEALVWVSESDVLRESQNF